MNDALIWVMSSSPSLVAPYQRGISRSLSILSSQSNINDNKQFNCKHIHTCVSYLAAGESLSNYPNPKKRHFFFLQR